VHGTTFYHKTPEDTTAHKALFPLLINYEGEAKASAQKYEEENALCAFMT
jgi:hypothetical protein